MQIPAFGADAGLYEVVRRFFTSFTADRQALKKQNSLERVLLMLAIAESLYKNVAERLKNVLIFYVCMLNTHIPHDVTVKFTSCLQYKLLCK
jgi:hypothetical protein